MTIAFIEHLIWNRPLLRKGFINGFLSAPTCAWVSQKYLESTCCSDFAFIQMCTPFFGS